MSQLGCSGSYSCPRLDESVSLEQLAAVGLRAARGAVEVAVLAGVRGAFFFRESLGLGLRAVNLGLLAVCEDDLVAAFQDLEGLAHVLRVVELGRPRLAEALEEGRV